MKPASCTFALAFKAIVQVELGAIVPLLVSDIDAARLTASYSVHYF